MLICAAELVLKWGVVSHIFGALLSCGTRKHLCYWPTKTLFEVLCNSVLFIKGRTIWICVHRCVHKARTFFLCYMGSHSKTTFNKLYISLSVHYSYAVKLLLSSSSDVIIPLSALCYCSCDARRQRYSPPTPSLNLRELHEMSDAPVDDLLVHFQLATLVCKSAHFCNRLFPASKYQCTLFKYIWLLKELRDDTPVG